MGGQLRREKCASSIVTLELRRAATELHCSLDTAVPYISQSNGVIERQNGIVYDGLRTLLDNARLALQLWPPGGEYFCDAANIGTKDPDVAGADRDCPYSVSYTHLTLPTIYSV